MRKQGAWMNWDHASSLKITWRSEPARLKFLTQSIHYVLPSPGNLHCWGLVNSPAYPLCQERGSLEHILSCCQKALGEGRYQWRHNQVLKAVHDTICTVIQQHKHQLPTKVHHLCQGQGKDTSGAVSSGLLTAAPDWQLKVEPGKQLKFPDHTARTTLRVDLA